MTVIGALSSFREPGEMSPHKRACSDRVDCRVQEPGSLSLEGRGTSARTAACAACFAGEIACV
jgi:hypothetical protein